MYLNSEAHVRSSSYSQGAGRVHKKTALIRAARMPHYAYGFLRLSIGILKFSRDLACHKATLLKNEICA